MTDPIDPTDYGFTWGPTEIQRAAHLPDGTRVIRILTNGRERLSIYISPTGRSVRAFNHHGELKAAPNA